jgi:SAM-dependent methyltransferase
MDLAAGQGGYSIALAEAEAKVVAVDLHSDVAGGPYARVSGDALALPFGCGSFDLVVCASLLEHVSRPRGLLIEIARVLRGGGQLYLSFPPFYSPLGGHQFSPFHLLGEKLAVGIAARRRPSSRTSWLAAKFPSKPSSYGTAFGSWGLYPMTIRKAGQAIAGLPFEIADQSTRWSPIDTSKIPILGEFTTWHVQFLLTKQ